MPVSDNNENNTETMNNNKPKDQRQGDLDDHEKDILILELQDDLFRSEKEKNDMYLKLNKKITDQDLKINELKSRIQKEMGI